MTMYSPLPQEDSSSPSQGRKILTRTPSPHVNRKLSTIRNWWLVLIIFVTSLLLMSLSLTSHQAPTHPAIKPIPENHQLADAIFHKVAPKNLEMDLHEEKTRKLLTEGDQHSDNPKQLGLRSCSDPVSKVGFMKTHKTASSTVQNILLRYGLNSDWNFVMLSSGSHLGPPSNQYSLTKPFSSAWIETVPWHAMAQDQGYNIFALHTKWDQGEVERVLGSGAKYVTILRDPVDEFESLYNYVHFEKTFQMDLEQFVSTYVGGRRPIQRVSGYLGRNQQLWDLGMDKKDITNHEAVKLKIKQMDEDFDLVMIAEDFDSSLALLSDALCWPLVNMTSLKLNARKKSAIEKLSPKSRKILKDWLWADYMLYDYFKKELEQKKKVYGYQSLEEEVVKLQKLNDEVKADCVLEVVQNSKTLTSDFVPWSKDVLAFKINEEKDYCKYFGISENHFIEHLRQLQMDRLKMWSLGLK
eukprot:GFUD01014772.1.p1 GENE.GFUD01014772.1~~GFUD01014772.1.p1  ORF type:complete len:468 (+),score=86.57 GFUD01014772.1:70-1473(+)